MPGEDTVSFLLRLPRETLEQIRALADKERRTVSGQIVYLLQRALAAQQ